MLFLSTYIMSLCGFRKTASKVLYILAFLLVCLGFLVFGIYASIDKKALEVINVSYVLGLIGFGCFLVSNAIFIHPREICEN